MRLLQRPRVAALHLRYLIKVIRLRRTSWAKRSVTPRSRSRPTWNRPRGYSQAHHWDGHQGRTRSRAIMQWRSQGNPKIRPT